jgi:hypothetical protein
MDVVGAARVLPEDRVVNEMMKRSSIMTGLTVVSRR